MQQPFYQGRQQHGAFDYQQNQEDDSLDFVNSHLHQHQSILNPGSHDQNYGHPSQQHQGAPWSNGHNMAQNSMNFGGGGMGEGGGQSYQSRQQDLMAEDHPLHQPFDQLAAMGSGGYGSQTNQGTGGILHQGLVSGPGSVNETSDFSALQNRGGSRQQQQYLSNSQHNNQMAQLMQDVGGGGVGADQLSHHSSQQRPVSASQMSNSRLHHQQQQLQHPNPNITPITDFNAAPQQVYPPNDGQLSQPKSEIQTPSVASSRKYPNDNSSNNKKSGGTGTTSKAMQRKKKKQAEKEEKMQMKNQQQQQHDSGAFGVRGDRSLQGSARNADVALQNDSLERQNDIISNGIENVNSRETPLSSNKKIPTNSNNGMPNAQDSRPFQEQNIPGSGGNHHIGNGATNGSASFGRNSDQIHSNQAHGAQGGFAQRDSRGNLPQQTQQHKEKYKAQMSEIPSVSQRTAKSSPFQGNSTDQFKDNANMQNSVNPLQMSLGQRSGTKSKDISKRNSKFFKQSVPGEGLNELDESYGITDDANVTDNSLKSREQLEKVPNQIENTKKIKLNMTQLKSGAKTFYEKPDAVDGSILSGRMNDQMSAQMALSQRSRTQRNVLEIDLQYVPLTMAKDVNLAILDFIDYRDNDQIDYTNIRKINQAKQECQKYNIVDLGLKFLVQNNQYIQLTQSEKTRILRDTVQKIYQIILNFNEQQSQEYMDDLRDELKQTKDRLDQKQREVDDLKTKLDENVQNLDAILSEPKVKVGASSNYTGKIDLSEIVLNQIKQEMDSEHQEKEQLIKHQAKEIDDLKAKCAQQIAAFQQRESQFIQKKQLMNQKYTQNEKTLEHLKNRLTDLEFKGRIEENSKLRNTIDMQEVQIQELQRQNNIKDNRLDEILRKSEKLQNEIFNESEQFTKTCLQLEVRRYQVEVLKGYLETNDIEIPLEVTELLEELESVDRLYPTAEMGREAAGMNASVGEDSDDSDFNNFGDETDPNLHRSNIDINGQNILHQSQPPRSLNPQYSLESLTLDHYRRQFGEIEGFGHYAEEKLRKQQQEQFQINQVNKNQIMEKYGINESALQFGGKKNSNIQAQNLGRLTGAEQRKYILQAIIKRLEKTKNQRHKYVDVQTDLASEYGSEIDGNNGGRTIKKTVEQQRIEEIIKDKSKSIADVLLQENFNSYHRNLNMNFASKMAQSKKINPEGLGAHSRPQGLQQSPQKNQNQRGDTIELTFDEEHEEDFKQMLQIQEAQNRQQSNNHSAHKISKNPSNHLQNSARANQNTQTMQNQAQRSRDIDKKVRQLDQQQHQKSQSINARSANSQNNGAGTVQNNQNTKGNVVVNSPMGDQSISELQHLRNNLVQMRDQNLDEENKRVEIQKKAIQQELLSLKQEENNLNKSKASSKKNQSSHSRQATQMQMPGNMPPENNYDDEPFFNNNPTVQNQVADGTYYQNMPQNPNQEGQDYWTYGQQQQVNDQYYDGYQGGGQAQGYGYNDLGNGAGLANEHSNQVYGDTQQPDYNYGGGNQGNGYAEQYQVNQQQQQFQGNNSQPGAQEQLPQSQNLNREALTNSPKFALNLQNQSDNHQLEGAGGLHQQSMMVTQPQLRALDSKKSEPSLNLQPVTHSTHLLTSYQNQTNVKYFMQGSSYEEGSSKTDIMNRVGAGDPRNRTDQDNFNSLGIMGQSIEGTTELGKQSQLSGGKSQK